jgi:hypothetical protein
LAVANYHDLHGAFPPPYLADAEGRPMHSWRILLLPYLDQKELYDAYDFSEPWDVPNNRRLAERMPRIYALHGLERPGNTQTNYLAVVGEETVWPAGGGVTYKGITDGSSNTIHFVENLSGGVHWMEPRDLAFDTMGFTLGATDGISSRYEDPAVVFADGQVRRLKPAITPETLRALLTIDGGERVQEGDDGYELLADGRDRAVRAGTR